MPNKKKTAFFSIEIAARELDAKCLLALETAKLGMRVYIGSFRALKQLDGKINECIFFHKSTWKKNAAHLKQTIGAHFVFLDEEMGPALPHSQLKNYLEARYRHVRSDDYKHSFAIGYKHKACMDSLENFKDVKVHALGWPRVDLWRDKFHSLYDTNVQRIKNENGHFYLLVSSFGTISQTTYQDAVKSHKDHYKLDSSRIDFSYKRFQVCLDLIKQLSPALKPDESIIVRPHTAESIDVWESLVVDYPNVFIRHKGDITPWLLASEGTIQFGSTAAIQATCMGVPCIQLALEESLPGITDTAAFEILDSAQSSEELLSLLRESKTKSRNRQHRIALERLDGLISNLKGSMASTEIAHVLQNIDVAPQAPIHFSWPQRFALWFKEQINYLNYLKSSMAGKSAGSC